jgi:hypothetical protein
VTGTWFRWFHAALLIVLGGFSGYVIPYILQYISKLASKQFGNKKRKTIPKNKIRSLLNSNNNNISQQGMDKEKVL